MTSVWSNHLAALNQRVPAGFVVVVQPPFVVIGDEAPRMVSSRATNTVKWAVDQLKQEYFQRAPVEIIDIWLFKDGESYTNHEGARLCVEFDNSPWAQKDQSVRRTSSTLR